VLPRSFLLALLVAAVLAPTAAAARKPKPHVSLALLPLPRPALGVEGTSLPLQWRDSGVVTNFEAADSANGRVLTWQLKKLGRVSGYALDYGDPFTGAAGVTEIKTSASEYRTAADASRALAFWRRDGRKTSLVAKGAFTITHKALQPARVGESGFSYLITEHATNTAPIQRADEQASDGRYVIEVSITAGRRSVATRFASSLLRKLDARVRRAVAGHLHGTPVSIPSPPGSAGPPPGGPDLSSLVVQPSDVGEQETDSGQGYQDAPHAVSDYFSWFATPAPFIELAQDVAWYPTTTEATRVAAYSAFLSIGDYQPLGSSGGGLPVLYTSLDVSSAGDHATAYAVKVEAGVPNGAFLRYAVVTLRTGQLVDRVLLVPAGAVVPLSLQSVANAMAKRLDAGFPG
jgi:hypothetical protein